MSADSFWLSQVGDEGGWRRNCYGHQWIEAMDTITPWIAFTTKNYLVQNVNSAEPEKPCFTYICTYTNNPTVDIFPE